MTDKKISELDAITGANTAATDVFVVVDTSTGQTKKITREELNNAIEQDVLSSIDIDTINGDFSVNGNINLGDNNKAIFGAGSDLQIYHSGTHSYIDDAGTGNLYIRSTNFRLNNAGDTQQMLAANDGGAVQLFNNGGLKLATTSTGIDVTGTVTADGLTVDGVVDVTSTTSLSTNLQNTGGSALLPTYSFNGSADVGMFAPSTNNLAFATFQVERMRITSGGNVGIGTSSPVAKLQIKTQTNGNAAFQNSTSVSGGVKINAFNDAANASVPFELDGSTLQFNIASSEKMRLDSSGNLLVGRTSTSGVDTDGHVIFAGGASYQSNTNNGVQFINRNGTDGAIITFYKSGSIVGVIGTQNWGIGESSPSNPLEVVGNVRIKSAAGDTQGLNISSDGNGDAFIDAGYSVSDLRFGINGTERMRIDSGGNAIFTKSGGAYLQLKDASAVRGSINVETSDGLVFTTGSSFAERMRIDSSGNVGIGTSSPLGKLEVKAAGFVASHISSDSTSETQLRFNTNTAARISNQANTALLFDTNATERMRIDSSGNVGIGTTSPASPLHVQADGVGIRIDGTADTTKTVFLRNTGTGEGQFHTDGNMHFLQEDASKYMRFSTANTERMRIDSSGRVLFKKSATGNTTTGVEINGTAGSSGSLSNATASGAGKIEATAIGNGYQSFMNLNMNSSTATGLISFQTQASVKGSIQWGSSSTSYNTTSDYRLKENVTNITDGIERVKQLNPSRFNFIADADTTVDGFLAHEAATVVPEAVSGEKDAVDADGNPEYQGIDQAKLVPLLTAALQEAITKIEDLEARVATLEGN